MNLTLIRSGEMAKAGSPRKARNAGNSLSLSAPRTACSLRESPLGQNISVFNIPCSGRTCKIAGADDFQALKCTRAEAVFLESAEMAEAGTAGVGRRVMVAGRGWRGH